MWREGSPELWERTIRPNTESRSGATEIGLAALVRESVGPPILTPATGGAPAPDKGECAMRAVGGFHSGVKDLGENHDKYLGELKRW